MQSLLLKQIWFMAMCAFYGVFLQVLISGLLIAKEGTAQRLKLEDVMLTIELDEVQLTEAFAQIEQIVGFNFIYEKKLTNKNKKLTLSIRDQSMMDVLRHFSKEGDLKFRRVNENIYVTRKSSKSKFSDDVIDETLVQEITLKGKVTDENGEGLPGASVIEKGTSNGTTTDLDGNYQINISGEADLVISYVGYKTLEVSVAGRSTIDIQMVLDAEQLEEIVITGYTGQSKRSITGSVEVIDEDELRKNPATRVDQQLQGKVSGVNIITNGAPGGGAQVRIRGYATFGNKDPLYIIDGVPGGGLNDINPNDIESVSVLKDASAASIYGARAANGVILITTKRGRKEQKAQLSYDVFYSLDFDGSNKPDVLTPQQWGELEFQGQRAGGNTTPSHPSYGSGNNPVIPEYLNGDPSKPYDPETNRLLRSANTDWYDVLTQVGVSQQHNLSIRGGSEAGTYALSFGYLDRQGTLIETSFQRYSTRLNSQFSFLDDRIRVGENITIAYSEANGNIGQSFRRFLYFPLIPRFDEGGNFGGTLNGILGLGTNFPNPEAIQVRAKDALNQRMRIFGNAYVEAEIISGLTIKSSIGVDFASTAFRRYNPEFPEGGNPGNSYNQNSGYGNALTWTNTLNYTKSFENHSLTVLAGTEAIENTGRSIGFSGTDYFTTDPNFLNISNAGTINSVTGGGGLTRRLASVFGKLDYSINDRYMASFTLRRDGSSALGPNNRFDVFPAAGVAWVISDESFLANVEAINFLKLSAGWGQVGNVNTLSNFAFANIYRSDSGFGSTGYDIGGTNANPPANGIALTDRGNADLVWETSETLNIGLNFRLFDNKISGSLEWYNRKTKDLIQRTPVPIAAGIAGEPFGNIGEIQNKGVDMNLSYYGQINSDFSFNVTGIVSAYKNKVIDINGNPDTFLPASYGNPLLITSRTQVGKEIGAFYGLIVDGVIQEGDDAGNFKFRDLNNDDTIDPLDDSDFIGSPHPDFTYSLNLSANYKNFDFTAFLRGTQGNDIFEWTRILTDFQFRDLNRNTRVLDAWTPTNPSNTLAEYNGSTANDNSRVSSYYVQDGSYLRLQTIQVGYTFSEIPGLNKLRLYLQGQNIFTMTGYTGIDPEIGENSGTQIAVDGGGVFSQPRSFLIGLNISL